MASAIIQLFSVVYLSPSNRIIQLKTPRTFGVFLMSSALSYFLGAGFAALAA